MANHRGGSGNFAEDRERASEAGKKVDSTAGVISRMTRSAHLKQVKRWQEQSRQKRQLAGLISDECILSEARQKVITAGYPGGFLFMAPDEQLLAVERQPTFCLTTH